MKRQLFTILGLGILACTLRVEAQPGAPKPPETKPATTNDYSKIFKDDKERNGYAIGMNYGMSMPNNLKRSEVEFDSEALIRGFKDGVTGQGALLTEDQVHDVIRTLQQEMRAKQAEKMKLAAEKAKVEGEKNKKEGEAFLAAKKTEAGVIPLPSGLMYKIIKEGSGESPKPEDTVTVNYKGTLIDGTEFDSSAKYGHPSTFGLRSVIKGWTEALELMKPGSKWELYIPSDLAYGEHGHPPAIGPNATLIFEIELISVQTPPPAPSASAAPLTSDIIKVPSAEELKKGAKIETIKAEDIEKERLKEAAKTNK